MWNIFDHEQVRLSSGLRSFMMECWMRTASFRWSAGTVYSLQDTILTNVFRRGIALC